LNDPEPPDKVRYPESHHRIREVQAAAEALDFERVIKLRDAVKKLEVWVKGCG
jgi:excinuclease UvrABC helicase subunit UvrB